MTYCRAVRSGSVADAAGFGPNRPEVMDESRHKGPAVQSGPLGKGEKVMSVKLGKPTDTVSSFGAGLGAGHGQGEVKFIGGFPTERTVPRVRRTGGNKFVSGGVVQVCGLRINARRVDSLEINGTNGTEWIMADGSRVPAVANHTVGQWFRFLLDTGSFAGVTSLR